MANPLTTDPETATTTKPAVPSEVLKNMRKTVAELRAPLKGLVNSFVVWRRASAPFALFAILVFGSSISQAAPHGARAEYLGGTRADIPGNNNGEIRVTDNAYFIFVSKHTQVKIPYERINLLEYGQKVDRHFVAALLISPLFMLEKKREHFLTVGFQDDDGHQQAMMFRVNKDDVRLALVSLEARTGQKVEFQDEEARIAGKG